MLNTLVLRQDYIGVYYYLVLSHLMGIFKIVYVTTGSFLKMVLDFICGKTYRGEC